MVLVCLSSSLMFLLFSMAVLCFVLFTWFYALHDEEILILVLYDASNHDEDVMELIGDENLEESLKLCQLFNYIPGIIDICKKMKR